MNGKLPTNKMLKQADAIGTNIGMYSRMGRPLRFSRLCARHYWQVLGCSCVLFTSTTLSQADPKENLAKLKAHLQMGEFESAATVANVLLSELPQKAEVAALRENMHKSLGKPAPKRDGIPATPSPLDILRQEAQDAKSSEAQRTACEKIIQTTNEGKPKPAADVRFWLMRGIAALALERQDVGVEVANALLESDLANNDENVVELVRAIDAKGWLKDGFAAPKPVKEFVKEPEILTVKPWNKKK